MMRYILHNVAGRSSPQHVDVQYILHYVAGRGSPGPAHLCLRPQEAPQRRAVTTHASGRCCPGQCLDSCRMVAIVVVHYRVLYLVPEMLFMIQLCQLHKPLLSTHSVPVYHGMFAKGFSHTQYSAIYPPVPPHSRVPKSLRASRL